MRLKTAGDEAAQDYEMNCIDLRFLVHKCIEFISVQRDMFKCLRLDFE